MKRILLITTGGTIACRRTAQGLAPAMDAGELLRWIPDAHSLCDADALTLLNKDSTEITPDDWLAMARAVRSRYEQYDGFVLTHGTDTMAYTSAALSYLIQGSRKPIVITGSQRPIDADINDARRNLSDALLYACDERAHGVSVVFDGDVIAGTRAKKVNTKSYNAFSSVNYPPLAAINDGRVLSYIKRDYAERPAFFDALESGVALVKLTPCTGVSLLEQALASCPAVLVESFGTGGLPERFYRALENGVRGGAFVVMTTQVPGEGSDMTVYKVGREIKRRLGLLEAFDMTLEAALAKLMWALALTRDRNELRRLFYTPVGEDILLGEA